MKLLCLYCSTPSLGSPDDPVELGSPIICGACCGLHVLDVETTDTEPIPWLRKPTRQERHDLTERADVKAFLEAYQADQIQSRLGRAGRKIKDLGMGGLKGVKHGDRVRMTAKGPDA